MKNGVRTLLVAVSLSLASAPLFALHVGGGDPHPQLHVGGGDPHPQSSRSWVDLFMSLFG